MIKVCLRCDNYPGCETAFILLLANSTLPGRNAIDGDNVYAIATETPTKYYDKTHSDPHRSYINTSLFSLISK